MAHEGRGHSHSDSHSGGPALHRLRRGVLRGERTVGRARYKRITQRRGVQIGCLVRGGNFENKCAGWSRSLVGTLLRKIVAGPRAGVEIPEPQGRTSFQLPQRPSQLLRMQAAPASTGRGLPRPRFTPTGPTLCWHSQSVATDMLIVPSFRTLGRFVLAPVLARRAWHLERAGHWQLLNLNVHATIPSHLVFLKITIRSWQAATAHPQLGNAHGHRMKRTLHRPLPRSAD